MNDNQKFVAGLILGAAAVAAAALFLQSEKGKEFMSNVKDAVDDAQQNLRQRLQNFDEEVAALLNKGKQFVEDLESKAKDSSATEV